MPQKLKNLKEGRHWFNKPVRSKNMIDIAQKERHTLSVIVDNEAGVLARVIGLFAGRGYNIEHLTVAPVDIAGTESRITVVTTGTPKIIEQIKAQLDRLVPIHRVGDSNGRGTIC